MDRVHLTVSFNIASSSTSLRTPWLRRRLVHSLMYHRLRVYRLSKLHVGHVRRRGHLDHLRLVIRNLWLLDHLSNRHLQLLQVDLRLLEHQLLVHWLIVNRLLVDRRIGDRGFRGNRVDELGRDHWLHHYRLRSWFDEHRLGSWFRVRYHWIMDHWVAGVVDVGHGCWVDVWLHVDLWRW